MQWVMEHLSVILTCLLVLSESVAAIAQVAFPTNKGVSGVIAGIIKFLQALGAKDPQAQ